MCQQMWLQYSIPLSWLVSLASSTFHTETHWSNDEVTRVFLLNALICINVKYTCIHYINILIESDQDTWLEWKWKLLNFNSTVNKPVAVRPRDLSTMLGGVLFECPPQKWCRRSNRQQPSFRPGSQWRISSIPQAPLSVWSHECKLLFVHQETCKKQFQVLWIIC